MANDHDDDFDFRANIVVGGPEEKAQFLQALRDGKVEFAPWVEQQMRDQGLTVDSLIQMLLEDQKKHLH